MKKVYLTTLVCTVIFLQGCLQNEGSKELNETLNQGDFTIVNAASGGTGVENSPLPSATPNPRLPVDEGFLINRGDTLATNRELNLDFYPPLPSAMVKISENKLCSGGQWISYEDSLKFMSTKSNQKVDISVQFRDYDNVLSPCYSEEITIDDRGPEIIFAKYPSGIIEEGSDVEIIFNVSDSGTGVEEVFCQVGAITKACAEGENKLLFKQLAEGEYHLQIRARDRAGFSTEKDISFKVSALYRKLSQNVRVLQHQKVDILFVIDNSGSMAYEQKSMASRVQNFLDIVNGLDWQIAVTTTDPSHKTLGDGRLVPLYGKTNSYIMSSTMPETEARQTLSMTLQRPETGSGLEQGIYAAYRAIERSISASNQDLNFIRSDAQLAVVLISDEDESANGLRNDPATFIQFIRDTFSGQKALSFHSVIARPDDTACLSGEGASAGYRYQELSNLTGGVIGDVCATDYAAQVRGIAEGVRKTLKSITLSCAPVVDNQKSIKVLKDGQPFNGNYQVSGLNITFDEMLPAGNYEVQYACLK